MNELILRFPLAKRYIKTFASRDKFEFQCDVNAKFYGISNFILIIIIYIHRYMFNYTFYNEH